LKHAAPTMFFILYRTPTPACSLLSCFLAAMPLSFCLLVFNFYDMIFLCLQIFDLSSFNKKQNYMQYNRADLHLQGVPK